VGEDGWAADTRSRAPLRPFGAYFSCQARPPISPRITTQRRVRSCPLSAFTRRVATAYSALYAGGLIPYWSKDPKIAWKCINARGETVKTAPAFRDAYKRRRCLVPADAFYEWKANGKTKQPYAIAMRDRHPFAFAGLWENWKDPAREEWVRTYTILTTKPNDVVARLHDRMPVVLSPRDYDQWLDTTADPSSLIGPYAIDDMVTWPVSTRVNKPENDDAAILNRLDATV